MATSKSTDDSCDSTNKTKDEMTEIHAKEKGEDTKNDGDLAALLDSALGDFDKYEKLCEESKDSKSTKTECSEQDNAGAKNAERSRPGSSTATRESDQERKQFAQDGASEFDRIFQQLMEEQPNVLKSFEDFATRQNDNSASEFASSDDAVASAVSQMAANAANLPGKAPGEMEDGHLADMPTEDELKAMFGSLGLAGGSDDAAELEGPGSFITAMHGMVTHLLSKDVLYPSLKDLLDKYPDWLNRNKGSLEEEDFTRFERQREIMAEVCRVLESEKSDDSIELKDSRFNSMIEKMTQLQEWGAPPKELLGDAAYGFEVDENGVPKALSQLASGMPNQCNPS